MPNKNIEEQIKKSLEKVRPSLQADGGDVEFMGYDAENGIVQVRMTGMCSHCPMAGITLSEGIEAEIKNDVPEVKKVVNI